MADAYLTTAEFKNRTGISLEDDIINLALIQTAEQIRNTIFIKQRLEYYAPNTKFKLNTPIADINGDGDVTKSDLSVFEFDDDNYVSPETDISAHISSFNGKYGYLVLDSAFPTADKILVIEYYIAKFPNDKMKYQLQRLNELLTVNYLFRTIPFNKLQEGITTWSLNSVNVSFDENTLNDVIKTNEEEIKKIFSDLDPRYSRTFINNDVDNSSDIRSFTRGIEYD